MIKKMTAALAGIGTGLVLLFTPSASAQPTESAHSVCDTGIRGQAAYDRECLVRGNVGDAGVAWYVGYTDAQRKADCRAAQRVGMLTVVRETRGDVLGDNFRNAGQVVRWTAQLGSANCEAWGYRL